MVTVEGHLTGCRRPVNWDPHGARQVYITNVRNQGIACGTHG